MIQIFCSVFNSTNCVVELLKLPLCLGENGINLFYFLLRQAILILLILNLVTVFLSDIFKFFLGVLANASVFKIMISQPLVYFLNLVLQAEDLIAGL